MHTPQKAKAILEREIYANIATVDEQGQPWNTPVYAVHDDSLKIYWRSWSQAQHSKNIFTNSKVFITWYDSTRQLGTNYQACLYMQACANVVEDRDDIQKALSLFINNDLSEDDFL